MVEEPKTIRPTGPRRRMVLQLVFALVIFLSGTVVGTGGTMQWLKHRGGRIGPPRPPRDPNELVARWAQEFDFNAEQSEQVKQVLVEVNRIRREAFQKTREQMEAAFVMMDERMQEILTPEQYQRWHEEFQKRRNQHRGPKGGWHRGGRHGGSRGPRDPNRRPPGPPPLGPPPVQE